VVDEPGLMQIPVITDQGQSISLSWTPLLSINETGGQDITRYQLLWDEGIKTENNG
jgi:hypothetical protein